MLVTKDNLKQLHEEGYFVLDRVISDQDLAELRAECQKQLDLQVAGIQSDESRIYLFNVA